MIMYMYEYVCLFCCVAVGLNVSAATVSNTSIGLQWSDDTPGFTNFQVHTYVAMFTLVVKSKGSETD